MGNEKEMESEKLGEFIRWFQDYCFPKEYQSPGIAQELMGAIFHPISTLFPTDLERRSHLKEKFFNKFRGFISLMRGYKIDPQSNISKRNSWKREAERIKASDRSAMEGMAEWKKKIWNTVFVVLQLGDQAIQFSKRESIGSLFDREIAKDKKVSLTKSQERESAFIGLALGEKLEALQKMDDAEFEHFTRRYPTSRPFLEEYRKNGRQVPKEEIPRVMDRYKASLKSSRSLDISGWWKSFTQVSEPIVSAPKETPTQEQSIEMARGAVARLRQQLFKTIKSAPSPDICPTAQNDSWIVPEKEHCVSLETMETDLQDLIDDVRPTISLDETGLLKYGNKHLNLIKMANLVSALRLSDPQIPLPYGISTDQVHSFLEQHAPEFFDHWRQLEGIYRDANPPLNDAQVMHHLEAIDNAIKNAFDKQGVFQDLGLSSSMEAWLRQLERTNDRLMVRSTGAEDSRKAANAGGNISKAYVHPTWPSVFEAVRSVIRSYFRLSSLQNRMNAGINPFKEKLSLAVTLQQLIGESIGASQDPSQIPISCVLFTNELLYIGGEKFRAMRLSATYGHGESVVSNQGIATDSVLILLSESQPDQLYYLYSNQNKPQRLAPLMSGDQIKLDKIDNPPNLAQKPALSIDQLMRLYTSGVLMEAFFDGPTDIEAVIKGNQIYFVQARPVNRKPMLPTHLNRAAAKDSIIITLQEEMLVPGKGDVITITKNKEVLFAQTLEEAERIFNPSSHKLVIVTHPEPENSHSVVNFSGLGIPCLYASDGGSVQALLNQIDSNHPLAVCMQTATLNLWNGPLTELNKHILEGFAVHPAKIAISLPVPEKLTNGRPALIPQDFKDLFLQLQRSINQKAALDSLNKLEQYPMIQSLQSYKKELLLQSSDPLASAEVKDRIEALLHLEAQITYAFQEARAAIKKGGQLRNLLRIKVLETLLFGTTASRSLGHLSLLDAAQLMDSISELSIYQKKLPSPAQLIELLPDGQLASMEAYVHWKQFLLDLEPFVQSGEITPQELEQFKNLISSLRKTGALAMWLTFFQRTEESSVPARFRKMLKEVGPSDQKLISSLLKQQQSIEFMKSQMDRFADPNNFENAWEELQSFIVYWSSSDWLDEIKAASPTVNVIACQVMEAAVTVLDSAVKMMKSSLQFPDDKTKIRLFKRMLQPYFHLMKIWALHFLSNNHKYDLQNFFRFGRNQSKPLSEYLSHIEKMFSDILANDSPKQLLRSSSFNLPLWMLGTTATLSHEAYNNYPKSLEDMLMLVHQNALVCTAARNEESISVEQLEKSFLPSVIKETINQIEKRDWLKKERPEYFKSLDNKLDCSLTNMQMNPQEIVIRYNIPLRDHSAPFELHYNTLTGQFSLEARLLGVGGDRWKTLQFWSNALEKSGLMQAIRPSFSSDSELSFSWIVNPQNINHILTEYINMAQASFNANMQLRDLGRHITNFYHRWKNNPELEKLIAYFYRAPLPAAIKFYEHSINEGQYESAIELAQDAMAYPEIYLDKFRKIINLDELYLMGLKIFSSLVKKNQAYQAAFEAATKPYHYFERYEASNELLSLLAERGYEPAIKEALHRGLLYPT
jgi:hypothetical protein